ncbi:MAG: hypothetical protein A2846_00090 [Candidatus Doudnabacteria bacterium RIFCSPHIGHO2_01_FULL_49_9]|uniref:Uncharacterized protein n=1 Tax=Candidatus Doudnabacteria bacterium RIFCSPHIGHO2_01_FULL_49_9 TaxID=1817827 RepID=A0A1F5P1P8_9BACT|nr:MAG: hypothetical protein A2846_00090 [Candidatus Doudnabacteria bacterium RIFCSPHIGHO2_01_FULL_49_9]
MVYETGKKLLKLALLLALVALSISYFQKDDLPDKSAVLRELYQEPVQIETSAEPFTIEREGAVYTITPLYEYELYGLVTSQHNAKSWFDYYHERWQDFINIKDLCVVWGPNLDSGVYQKIKFSNGSFTCYWNLRHGATRADWAKFKNEAVSNNHILSASEQINEKLKDIQVGDQIYFKGHLVSYTFPNGGTRGSSTTRTDTWNGACETVYITDLVILKKANQFWRLLFVISKYTAIASFLGLVVLAFWPDRSLKNSIGGDIEKQI